MEERAVLIGPAKVAAMLHVSPKTVARWSVEGKIPVAFRTLGGGRRLYDPNVIAQLAARLTGNGGES